MKNLLLMRHANAAEKLIGQTDHDRELTLLGERHAGEAGIWMKKHELVPQLVLCSTAVRTLATCHEVLESFAKPVKVQHEKVIYSGSETDMLHLVQDVDEQVDTLLLIGHNPTISILGSLLANEEISFEPANVALLQFQAVTWEEVKSGQGKLTNFYRA